MKPISFHPEEVSYTSSDPTIEPLPVLSVLHDTGEATLDRILISCWKPGLLDILRIILGRPVFLAILGGSQPPVSLSTDSIKTMERDFYFCAIPFSGARPDSDDTETWQPVKVFLLKKEIPGLWEGARFQQTAKNGNIYFCAIPISSARPEEDQVGIVKLEAQHVENNPEWFEEVVDDE